MVSDAVMQTLAIVVLMGLWMANLSLLLQLRLLLQLSVSSPLFCTGWSITVFPQNLQGRRFLKASWPLGLLVICLKAVSVFLVV